MKGHAEELIQALEKKEMRTIYKYMVCGCDTCYYTAECSESSAEAAPPEKCKQGLYYYLYGRELTPEMAAKIVRYVANDYHHEDEEPDAKEALLMAERALRREIPKKPYEKVRELAEYDPKMYVVCYCPNCAEKINSSFNNLYCGHCGQKVDWSDTKWQADIQDSTVSAE